MEDFVKFERIDKSYDGEVLVVKDLNVDIAEGEFLTLLGPSGSGKSTLLNLLSLIDRPNSGTIKFENNLINFSESNENDILRAKKIGIVYQQDNLLPDFTSLENIYLASLAAGNNKKISLLKAKNLLKKVGLLNRSDHYPSQLSGGEKQRLSIARAFLKDSKIILLDEATSSLDSETEEKIQKALDKLTLNKTTVVIAHRLSTILNSDKIYVVDNGEVTDSGDHESLLLSSKVYKNFYEKQINKN